MSRIVAVCPYCRAGGIRAPSYAVGASARCPKCGSNFTVMPSDDLPDWAKTSPAPRRGVAAPVAETTSTAALSEADVTEPSPTLPPEDRREPTVPVTIPVVTLTTPLVPSNPVEPAEPDSGLVPALLALTLFGPAVLASQLPYGRIIALVLAVVGLVGGFLSLGGEGRAKLVASVAAILHALLLAIVLVFPSWLNLEPWREGLPRMEPRGPVAVGHGDHSVAPADWVDAGLASWRSGDVQVTVRSATVATVKLRGAGGAVRPTKESYLVIRLRVSNEGFEHEVALSGWASGQGTGGVLVTDPRGRKLGIATLETVPAGEHDQALSSLLPGRSSTVQLTFTAPVDQPQYLRLVLSGAAIGSSDDIKFHLGATFLARPRSP